jgi:hypothetical protein
MISINPCGLLTLNHYFFNTDWEAIEDASEDEFEDYDTPDYEDSCIGLIRYEDVPPPSYDVAIMSPPAY